MSFEETIYTLDFFLHADKHQGKVASETTTTFD